MWPTILKKSIATLGTFVVFILLFMLSTGGIFFNGKMFNIPLRLELSQLDTFSFIFFGLTLLHKKISGEFLFENKFTIFFQKYLTTKNLTFAVLAYILVHTFISIFRFQSFHANAFDLGYIDQALWSTANFKGFLYTSLARNQTYLGEHFSPLLALVSSVYFISDSIWGLFIFQAILFGSSALLIYKISNQKKLKNNLAVFIALCFLIYQPLRASNIFELKEDNLFIPVFLSLFWAAEKNNLKLYFFFSVLCLLIKENAGIFVMFSSLVYWQRSQHNRVYPLIAVLSLVAFFLINSKVTPYFAGASEHTMLSRRLSFLGTNNKEIFINIFLKPGLLFSFLKERFLQIRTLKYFALVCTPLCITFILAKKNSIWFLIAFSVLLMNVLVNLPTIGFHYECLFIPFAFIGMIEILATTNVSKNTGQLYILGLSFFLFFGRSPIEALRRYQPNQHHKFVTRAIAKIPAQASIATQSDLYPHLDHRMQIELFSWPSQAEFIVVDLQPDRDQYATPNLLADLDKIDPNLYEKILDQNHLKIWQKKTQPHLQFSVD